SHCLAACLTHSPSLRDALPISEDVAWSWNTANPNLTPDVVHDTGAEIAEAVTEVEVLDANTVRFHWNNFASFVPLRMLTNYSERSEEHTSELQSRQNLVCRLLL